MNEATRTLVREWIAARGIEGAARYLSKLIRCPLKTARALVNEAAN
jgi:hypothetical protein